MSQLIGVVEVAEILGVSPSVLRSWRFHGTGPASFKLGGKVVYDKVVLQAWINQQRKETTRGEQASYTTGA